MTQIKESLQRDTTVWSRDSQCRMRGKQNCGTSAKLKFASQPSEAPIPERTNSTIPDAYLLLVKKKSVDIPEDKAHTGKKLPDSWDNITVSFEYKKDNGDTDCKDDGQRVIWSLPHIMRGDPCRHATFGVTIENMEMRFWFTCRAVTLVSKSFNFCTEPEHLIYFFCSLAFAEDHELGWDPTIQRVGLSGKIQYNITVHMDEGKDLVHWATRVISDHSADALSGRRTRVFEARLIFLNGTSVKDAEPVVLKDSWRDGDRDREGVILNRIFADLQKHKGPEQEEEARKYFLTVLAAGNVMVDGNIDNTDRLLHESDLQPDHSSYQLPVDEIPKVKPIRTHFRLVFREVCEPLYELTALDTVFMTLEDVCKVVAIFLRWDKLGKLADLKYAKRMDSDTSHEVRTEGHQLSSDQTTCFRELFPGRLNSRTSALLTPLNVAVLPISFQPLARIVNDMRRHLRMAYTACETNMAPVYADALEQLHSIFTRSLSSVAEHSTGVKLFRPPAARRQEDSSAKHQQEDPMAEPRDPKQPRV
ncbi:hypothetical protein EDD16DRAFT_1809300 [Pisolithus croceorrhizus]|nr:hypothetical protein EDD16DRAFT_1809300 [Pisolithus croceorrhizus]